MTRDGSYFDCNATTPVDARVVAVLMRLLTEHWANPSSAHREGAAAAAEVEAARAQVAAAISAREREIVFTSGGTEADNAALRGVTAALPGRRHVVVSTVEHHAVLDAARALERDGIEVSRIRVDRAGRLDLDQLADAIRPDTALVSIMLANNETGVVFPIREVCDLAHARGALAHTDAVNALGKRPVDVQALGVDLLSLSAHKIYGPKGVGALFLREGTPFRAVQVGGAQERGLRGGTLNSPGIAALGAACRLLASFALEEWERQRALRDRIEATIAAQIPDATIVGQGSERLPNTSCVCFAGLEAEPLVLLLSEMGICVSSGAACASGATEPSHVLAAMGLPRELARGQIRISLGRRTTQADVDRLLHVLPTAVARVRAMGP